MERAGSAAMAFPGAFWLDGVPDLDDVQLLGIVGPAGQALFDVVLPPVVTAAAPAVAGEAAVEDEQQQEEQQDLEQGRQPAPKPKKKKSLSRAEKARIEREKNRIIQSRYRQRQKERKATLAADYEAAATDLVRLRAESELLRHQNAVLESVLAVRDSELGVLEAAHAAAEEECDEEEALPVYDPSTGSFWAPAAAPCGSGGASDGEQGTTLTRLGGGVGGGAAGDADGARGGGGPRFAELRESASEGDLAGVEFRAGPSTSASEAASNSEASGPGGGVGGGGRGQLVACTAGSGRRERLGEARVQVPRAAIEKAKGMTPEDYFRNWQEFASRLRDVLAEYDLTRSPQALEELEPLLKRRAIVMTLMIHHNAPCVKSLFARSGEQGRAPEAQREYWARLVASMEVSPHQRQRFCCLWDSYRRKAEQLRARRNQALSLISQAARQEEALPLGAANMSGMMAQYLQMLEGASSLAEYPDSEFLALLELLSETGRILTPLQKARMASYSYPLFPDVLQVLEAIVSLPARR